jgi:hypothetical protein
MAVNRSQILYLQSTEKRAVLDCVFLDLSLKQVKKFPFEFRLAVHEKLIDMKMNDTYIYFYTTQKK